MWLDGISIVATIRSRFAGALNLAEFQKCIREAGLGLTRKEINTLMLEVDSDRDGMVTYEEFAPLCFDILVEVFKEEILKVSLCCSF